MARRLLPDGTAVTVTSEDFDIEASISTLEEQSNKVQNRLPSLQEKKNKSKFGVSFSAGSESQKQRGRFEILI